MWSNVSMELNLRSKWSCLAVLGAGCLVGVSGVYLVQRLSQRLEWSHDVTSSKVSRELTVLNNTIRDLQAAIRDLQTPSQKPLKSALRSVTFSDVEEARIRPSELDLAAGLSSAASTTSTTEYFSVVSSDDDDEFFDLPNDSEIEDLNQQLDEALSVATSLSRGGSDPSLMELFPVVDQLLESHGSDQAQALAMLREKESELGENCEFLWRLCKAIYLKSIAAGLAGDTQLKRVLIIEAVTFGEAAVAANESSSEAHKWYAIVVGCRGEFVGIKDKILDGYEFKKHVDRAAELSPTDHTIQHLLGRFCFEVSELSWWERKTASALFAEPPSASMDEARDHFLAAERLKPEGWKENRQFLAKSLIKMGEFEQAVHWLEKADELPIRNPDDQQAQDDVSQMLEQYGSLNKPS
eukprot:maker-scaffold334_size202906-snap-gene-0.14 protein:Tk08957 transcript:maker-scaffold334_size202906-snap-gene-0.14-mRNA-1 annotation:"regulator of microtubule dynamics protein 3"